MLLNEATDINVVAVNWWLMLPVVPVILVILAYQFMGDGMRDAADPYALTAAGVARQIFDSRQLFLNPPVHACVIEKSHFCPIWV